MDHHEFEMRIRKMCDERLLTKQESEKILQTLQVGLPVKDTIEAIFDVLIESRKYVGRCEKQR